MLLEPGALGERLFCEVVHLVSLSWHQIMEEIEHIPAGENYERLRRLGVCSLRGPKSEDGLLFSRRLSLEGSGKKRCGPQVGSAAIWLLLPGDQAPCQLLQRR